MDNQLYVKFEGPNIGEEGVSLDDLQKTFNHLQKALWLMVSYLEGVTTPSGRPPARVRRGSVLRLMGTSPGSLVAELGIPASTGIPSSVGNASLKAIDLIVRWHPEEDYSLPTPVAEELLSIGSDLSTDVAYVRLSDPGNDYHVDIPRKEPERLALLTTPLSTGEMSAQLHGWLREVDWDKRTARLHRYEDRPVQLRFNSNLDEDMHWLARQYVEVIGHGRINRNDQWTRVQVEQIDGVNLIGEPFDLEAFWNNPNPKIFRSDEVVRASEPFDVDEFNRIIREGRDV